ncbi:glutaredoxin [Pseudoxanthomonas sp. 3HH-4]|nr:glutaredoxin [Pseudoxanthomonas sp. 3HH-4]
MKRMLPLIVVVAALLVGLGGGRVYSAHKLAKSNDLVVTRGDYALYLPRPGQVAFYSLGACGGCEKTRKLLRELGVDYVERPADTSTAHRQELHRLGAKRVPVIVTTNAKLEGYDRGRMIGLLEEQGYLSPAGR